MTDYRKTLYESYYSNHSGETDASKQESHFRQQVRYFTRELVSHFPADRNAKILDLGCGFGSMLMALKNAGYSEIEGIDLSAEQLEMARKFGVENVEQADALEFLRSASGQYDAISAIDVLEHQTPNEAVEFLSLVKEALKPGGKVIMRVPNLDAPQASVFANADFTHELFLNKSSALQLFRSIGFRQTQIHRSLIFIENPLKELLRKCVWALLMFRMKLELFATGRTWDSVCFTPNIIITALK